MKKLYEARLEIKSFSGEITEKLVTAKSIRKLYIRMQETYHKVLGSRGGVIQTNITRIR